MTTDAPVLYGKYQLLEQIARGGMAELFKAKAHGVEGFEKILVIKRILPELGENPRFVDMFINEAKIAVTLSHANVVQVFDLGKAEGSYFIAMEYVAGMDLATLLSRARKSGRKLSPELAVFVISELAKGLDYAHRRRDAEMRPLHIIHRDVSPQNVLLSWEGEVKLTDFGIAKARTAAREVTELGVIKGKYAYMSPEQLGGGKLDSRSDIFSAGTLLYEALAGRNPFQESSTYDTLQRIREGSVMAVEEAVPGLPEEIGRIVRKAMAFAPEQRYSTAGDLYEDLIQYLYGSGRRVSARDLGEFLSSQRAAGEEGARLADRFEAVFEVTQFDEPLPDRTRVERGRKPAPTRRDTPTSLASQVKRERTEWRDVTVLAFRLDADDPVKAETIARLVERFGGNLLRDVTLPDEAGARGGVALFGHMEPDGRDADNAARCALKLARAATAAAGEAGKSTTLGLVVCTGRVLLDLDGALLRDEAFSELMSSAFALLAKTGEGQILTDSECEKTLRSRFRLVPAGRQAADAHLLASERSVTEAYGRFIGRRTELRQVGECLARANLGTLQVVGLHGEAGSGKSRLLVETMRRLGLAGHNVGLHVAVLTPQMREVPLSAIQEMLRSVLGVDEFDPDSLLRDRTTRLRELGLLSVEQAAVATVLGLPAESRRHEGQRPLRAALLRILRKLAEDRLTIFAFDGAEYMDAESESMAADMLRAVSAARIGVFLCYRPGYRPPWAHLPTFHEVRLAAMNDEDTARLTATRLGAEEIPFELLREVSAKAGGNPLHVEEYLKALQGSGAVTFADGQVRYNPAASQVDVPKTLRGIVASRIARLSALERYVLQVAALVGERFHVEIVAGAAQEDVRSVAAALESPPMQGIVASRGASEHMFSHGLVQQVLIEGVPLPARKQIHAAIAETLMALFPERLDEMAERLARHFHEAGNDAQAVHHLGRAVDRLQDEGALDAATTELRRAIDILAAQGGDDRSALLEHYDRLADLCFRNRNLVQGAEWMDRAIKAAESSNAPAHAARFCMWRGRMLVAASRVEEGRQWLEQAQHIARGVADPVLARDVLIATADADARRGDFDSAIELLRESLTLSRSTGEPLGELRALLPLALTYARMGDHQSAMITLVDAKRRAEGARDSRLMSQIHRLESQIHYHARDQEASARAAGKAMEVAREAGLLYEAALNAHNMGEAFLRLADHRRAFAALRQSYEVAAESGYTRLQMSNLSALGFIDATRFDSAEGRARVQQAIEYAEKHEFVWDVIQGKFYLAIIEQRRGDHESARARMREVLDLAVQHGHRNYTEDAESALLRLDRREAIHLPR